MPVTPGHTNYQNFVLEWCRKHKKEPDVAPALKKWAEAALILWQLDLEPARPVLAACYSPVARGLPPQDPIVLLRCLLLAALVGQPSINDWVDDLEAHRVLRILAGLPEDKHRPGVGTFYDFLHRLHDGPVRKTCEHVERPSENERRRAATPRRLKRRATTKKEQAKQRQKRAQRRRRKRRRALTKEQEEELRTVTGKLVAELEKTRDLDNPNDLLGRLAAILIDTAVMESARRGLLGDVDKLVLGGDGSVLRTGANRHGKRACGHKTHERCDCPKHFSDPDAQWGWDSYNDQWYFGHHFYEISTSNNGHDLPLAISLAPGNESDYTASLHTFDHLFKSINARLGSWAPEWFIADAGHDAEAIHRYLIERGIKPVIPLKAPARATHPNRPEVNLSKRGVPMCQAGVEMAPWGSAGKGRVNFLCPVRAGKLDRCPLAPDDQPDWHCRPDLRYGPTTVVKTAHNPRLFPALPRNSPRYTKLYKHRSGCERSNSVKKETFRLEAARHRRASFWLIRLHFIAVLQHAKAWVAESDAGAHVDFLLGKRAEPVLASA